MLRELRIEFAEKHQCGIDDCWNIAKVCVELISRYGEAVLYETKYGLILVIKCLPNVFGSATR